MKAERLGSRDSRIDSVVVELRDKVAQRFPEATFEVFEGEDPDGTYLRAIVDIEDTDQVVDLVIDHLLDLQVEERLPLYFVASRPLERALQQLESRSSQQTRRGGRPSEPSPRLWP